MKFHLINCHRAADELFKFILIERIFLFTNEFIIVFLYLSFSKIKLDILVFILIHTRFNFFFSYFKSLLHLHCFNTHQYLIHPLMQTPQSVKEAQSCVCNNNKTPL